jgi:hypothetical protein
MMPPWVQKLFDAVKPTIPPDFVGRIEINVFKGGVSNVNVVQSFKEEAEPSGRRR